MTFNEWKNINNIDLKKIHGNIGDYYGNICIENNDGTWTFWNNKGEFEIVNV